MKQLAPTVVVLLLPLVCGCHHSPAFGTKPPPKVTVAPVVEKEITEWNEYIGRTDAVVVVENVQRNIESGLTERRPPAERRVPTSVPEADATALTS